jgi:hypothetical protein
MIPTTEFQDAWKSLCRRHGRTVDAAEAAEVHRYLNDILSAEEFRRAARHVWATREFFPRPADFVTANAAFEWAGAIRAKAKATGEFPWRDAAEALSPRGREALRIIGGLDVLVDLYQRDPLRARAEFLAAYELHAGELAQEHARLQPPKERAEIGRGSAGLLAGGVR